MDLWMDGQINCWGYGVVGYRQMKQHGVVVLTQNYVLCFRRTYKNIILRVHPKVIRQYYFQQIYQTLRNSYVNDVDIGITLKDIKKTILYNIYMARQLSTNDITGTS